MDIRHAQTLPDIGNEPARSAGAVFHRFTMMIADIDTGDRVGRVERVAGVGGMR